MCRPVRCRTCGKTTWAGCGEHVDQVRRSVPADQWCPGHDDARADAPSSAPSARGAGLLDRLLGR